MNINLPPDQLAFIENLVESGRFASADDVVGESVRLLGAREQLRQQIQAGVEQADRGELVDHETVFASLRQRAANSDHSSLGE